MKTRYVESEGDDDVDEDEANEAGDEEKGKCADLNDNHCCYKSFVSGQPKILF